MFSNTQDVEVDVWVMKARWDQLRLVTCSLHTYLFQR